MTTTVTAAGLFDPTGVDDIADALAAWINRVPDGTGAHDLTRVVLPPGTYRNEGGLAGAVTCGSIHDVSFDCPGVTFVQRTKKPFVVKVDPSNGNENSAGRWNIIYTPTNVAKATYEGWLAGAPAFERATAKAKLLNRGRSFFRLRKCERVRLRGMKIRGGAGTAPAYSADYEAQNGVNVHGSLDCELDDVEIGQTWGNGIEANAYVEDDGTYTAPLGLWVHDSALLSFGRQAASLTYGGRFIFERCDLGGSARSLIDMEPTTNRNDPALNATVQGVHVLGCNIGPHRLGMIAAGLTNGDVRGIRVAGCRGFGIGTSGTSYAQGVIFEDNVSTDSDSTPNPFKFAKGPQWGGKNLIVRRNRDWYVSEAGVQFHDGQGGGGCTNYLVEDNDFRGRGQSSAPQRQFIDNNRPPWSGKFVPFDLPTPAHALRDLS